MAKIKYTLLIFLLIIGNFHTNAQLKSDKRYRIGLTGGIGKYIQNDLKEINENVQGELDFETELVEDFPANYFWGLFFLYKLSPQFYIGPSYQFHTTGSRIGVKDYSGSYTFDQILSCHSFAVEAEETFSQNKKLKIALDFLAGVNFSMWEIKEEIIIGDQSEKSSVKLTAIRPFICASAKLKYPISNRLTINLSAGYNIDLMGKYKVENSNGAKSDQQASWTGPRASLGLDYSF